MAKTFTFRFHPFTFLIRVAQVFGAYELITHGYIVTGILVAFVNINVD